LLVCFTVANLQHEMQWTWRNIMSGPLPRGCFGLSCPDLIVFQRRLNGLRILTALKPLEWLLINLFHFEDITTRFSRIYLTR